MHPSAVQDAPWPLGKRFVDANGRTFEVVKTIYGNLDSPVLFTIEFENGWSISWEKRDSPQTAVGFVQQGTDKVIIQPVELMDEYVRNGHLGTL